MNKSGPIVVVDDDNDDLQMITEVLKNLGCTNEIVTCTNGLEAFEYLNNEGTHPFLILSDINMPVLDGFGLRDLVREKEEVKGRCIPFVVISTSGNDQMVLMVYKKSVQGYFIKPQHYQELHDTIKTIVQFWQICYMPGEDTADDSKEEGTVKNPGI